MLQTLTYYLKKYQGTELVFIEGKGWWFKDPSKYWLHIIPLQDRIEKAVVQVLRREHKIAYDAIYRELVTTFKNGLTTSHITIRETLEEYAEKTKDGQWRIKHKVEEEQTQHSLMLGILAELGRKANYKVWIGRREQHDIYDGKPLESYCDFDNLSFLNLPSDQLSYIDFIDLLWFDKNKIKYAFEIENTTAITEAINRCSNIPPEHDTKKVIVIPTDREAFLHKKLKSELLKPRIESDKWRFIFYDNLLDVYDKHKKAKSFDVDIIEKIARTPTDKTGLQETLDRALE